MTINCNRNLVDLSTPKIMGILNVTPDSFYDGGKFNQEYNMLKQVDAMLSAGATFIDVGGFSSRPGADTISEEEELKRVATAVERIVQKFPEAIISVDTFRSNVAEKCIDIGAAMVNDISGGDIDPNMMPIIAKHQVPYIMMHMKGSPKDMQQKSQYEDVVIDVMRSLSEKIERARKLKVNDIILDPGFGFAKTVEQNYGLLSKLELFQHFHLPILVGLSRKSMIYKVLDTTPQEALNGTSVVNTIALMKGAHIVRVHDVKEAVECLKLVGQLN